MALISVLAVAIVFGVVALINYVAHERKMRETAGVRQLPGPKGMSFVKRHILTRD